MVLSPEADTMYLSSKSTTLTAARCPTRTRRKVMSVGEAMSHTAMDLSLEHVTISPLLNLRCSTASLWWISVFRTSPVFTSHTLRERTVLSQGKLVALQGVNRHKPAPVSTGELWLANPWQGLGKAGRWVLEVSSGSQAVLHVYGTPSQ